MRGSLAVERPGTGHPALNDPERLASDSVPATSAAWELSWLLMRLKPYEKSSDV
jgi:hypothetical protein